MNARPTRTTRCLFVIGAGLAVTAAGVSRANAAQSRVDLGTATSFAVLGGSTVTNTGPSVISGDLGVSPGTAVTGFPPGLVNNGTIHAADAVAAQAQDDVTTAYNSAAGRSTSASVGADLAGQTLVSGVYTGPTLGLTGTVTLDAQGDPAAVFIFQAGSTLITSTSSRVSLINGASACNVFWQVGSSATLGTASVFVGTVLALTSVTANTGATVQGRLLARNGAVTLDTNRITSPTCSTAPTTTTSPPTTTPPTTTPPTTTPPTTTPPTTTPPTTTPPTTTPPTTTPPTTAPPTTAPPTTAPPTTAPPTTAPPTTAPPTTAPPTTAPPTTAPPTTAPPTTAPPTTAPPTTAPPTTAPPTTAPPTTIATVTTEPLPVSVEGNTIPATPTSVVSTTGGASGAIATESVVPTATGRLVTTAAPTASRHVMTRAASASIGGSNSSEDTSTVPRLTATSLPRTGAHLTGVALAGLITVILGALALLASRRKAAGAHLR